MSNNYTKDDLVNFKPNHSFFVGIDSDGCVFDSMEIKQKQCFHKLIVSHWQLEPIEKEVREAAEFINLYSKWRGQNRFLCLLRSIDLLRDRPEVVRSGVTLPLFTSLRQFIDSGATLGNPALETAVAETGDKELASLLEWSKAVNNNIANTANDIPPFPLVRESLEILQSKADCIVVSQTPAEALMREWREQDLDKYVRLIAGQELGTKTEHLKMATHNRYKTGCVLMIGDAPGDLKAARANNALFYPINPGKEEASWQHFHDEAINRFLSRNYTAAYEKQLIDSFQALLPETPPWRS